MALVQFEQLPDTSRLWIFEANAPFDHRTGEALAADAGEFLTRWTAHGKDLKAAFQLELSRFLLLAVDQHDVEASGCSIDALMRFVRSVGELHGISFLDRNAVTYRDTEGLHRVSRSEFSELSVVGAVDGTTRVFDNTIDRVGSFRSGVWEIPAAHSWHKALLK